MKKPLVLTAFSLAGILAFAGAHAATDVTFAGKYETSKGTASVGTPLDAADYKYTYVDYNGSTVTKNYTEDPDAGDFKYKDAAGNWQAYDPENTDSLPQQSEYTGTTTASGDITTTQEIVAGATMDRNNYTYKNSEGTEVTLGESAHDFTQDVTLNNTYVSGDDATITVKNGDAPTFDGTRYKYTDENGNTYHLNTDGTSLANDRNEIVTPEPGSTLETAFNGMQAAFTADTASVDAAKTSTGASYTAEAPLFNAANTVFENDTNTVNELNNRYATIATAGEQWDAALANKETTTNGWTADSERQAAASEIFNAPITDTIDGRANDAIAASVADGGVINDALTAGDDATLASAKTYTDEKDVAVRDDFAAADAQIRSDMTAGDDAVRSEFAAADTQIRSDMTAGDQATLASAKTYTDDRETVIRTDFATADAETLNSAKEYADTQDALTLNNAKAYTNERAALSLAAANAYTDKKIDKLDKDLSAGIASSVALSSVAVSGVQRGEVSVGAGFGNYNSQSAVAFGAAMGLTNNWSVNVGAGVSDADVAFRAGTNYKFKLF